MKYLSLLFAIVLVGCASSNAGDVYSRDETRQIQHIKMGVVESVRQVKIEGTDSKMGAVAGGVVGGVAGSSMGKGRGEIITGVLGAVAGALVGSAAEEAMTKKDGLEITVKLDSGDLVAIVQEATEEFHPGEKVRLLESGGITRVSH
ncbi:MAG TPA: glycine zipper 2TM domain-containing protein [Methylophilaceae bacterium]|jgi:outer membrane lipoprotein SlyB